MRTSFLVSLLMLVVLVVAGVGAARAGGDSGSERMLPDIAQEQTARRIFRELRCVVCEGQSIAESNATLAAQMRIHVRTLVAQGKSRAEILAFFREAYGDSILLTPPLRPSTWLLWLAPLLLLAVGGLLLRRATQPPQGGRP
ncbi:MAG: cytochrome c-type biogenesis protein [Alphaproteobacteria bacterium]|nr:cytochrome c-type biogenesis protein [Alphaproteobacteria bacterium]